MPDAFRDISCIFKQMCVTLHLFFSYLYAWKLSLLGFFIEQSVQELGIQCEENQAQLGSLHSCGGKQAKGKQ